MQPYSRAWRLGTTSNAFWEGKDEGEDIWEVLRAGGFGALGWEPVGDPFDLFQLYRGNPRGLHLALRTRAEEAGVPRAKAALIASQYRLYDEVSTGDVIVAARGGRFLAVGIVSEPTPDKPN